MFGFLKRKPKDPLDAPLLRLTQHDPFTLRHLLNGGVLCLGQTGSGKTSSTGRLFGRSILQIPRSGGVILASKPDELALWQARFAECGRSDDLVVFSPAHAARCNFLDYELRNSKGETRDLVKFITVIAESLRGADTKGDGDGFWLREMERMLYNGVEIVRRATGRIDTWGLHKFFTDAAQSPDQFKSPEWRAGHHSKMLEAAWNAPKDAAGAHDTELAMDYWGVERPAMADKTRSSIDAHTMGVLHVFNTGQVRELVSTTTNVSPDDVFAGRWLVVDMPPSVFGDEGLLVAAGWKYLLQRAVLRRRVTPESNVVTIWGDEAHLWVNSFDGPYTAMCRSNKGCMVYLSQSLPSFYGRMGGGDRAKHQADGLLGNFGLRVFNSLGCPETAKWASSLIGSERQAFIGGSSPAPRTPLEAITGLTPYSGSFSEHVSEVVQPREFMSNLRTGGPANGFLCDAICVRSGGAFANGSNWILTSFSQKG